MKYNLLYCLVFLTISLPAQEIYSWVDNDGIVKYSDKIPDHIKMADITKISINHNNSFKSLAQIAKEEGKTPSQQQQQLAQISKGNCDIATQNFKILTAFKQITQLDNDGNEVVLSDEEKTQQINLTKKQIEIFCTK